jgi:deazaflavin-dependent oxidoreductase (nitroreductase family)
VALKFKVNASRRVADTVTKVLLSLRLAPKGYYLLTTIGRKTGISRSNPVTLIEEGNRRWLVSPFGNVSWVYNAKASGKVTLTRNGKSETVAIRECSAEQAAPVLRKYVMNVPITRPYFDVGIDSSEEAYLAEVPKHPVFEIVNRDS